MEKQKDDLEIHFERNKTNFICLEIIYTNVNQIELIFFIILRQQ